MQKKKKPKFNVPNLGFFRSVKARWRKPRGTHNKKRMKQKWAGALPKIGYRNAVAMRHVHPSGAMEALVNSLAELDGLKGRNVLVRVGAAVGARKRKLLAEKAKSLSLTIINLEKTPWKSPGRKTAGGGAKAAPQPKGAKK